MRRIMQGWGDGTVGEATCLQARGPESDPQSPCQNAKHGGLLVVPALGEWRPQDPWGLSGQLV